MTAPLRPAGVVGVLGKEIAMGGPRIIQGPPAPAQTLSINTAAIYAAIERRVHKVVIRAGRMALGSAIQRAPVRKVFSGGRQRSPRFYTLKEAKMELPSFLRTEPRHPSGELMSAQGRTVIRGGRMVHQTGALEQLLATPIRSDRNKANNWQKTGQRSHKSPDRPAPREVSHDVNTGQLHLTDRSQEYGLTARGKWELKNGRAISVGLGARSAHRHQSQQHTEQVKRALDLPAAIGELGGTLRRSIEMHDRTTARGPKVSIVAGGDDAPYARFVEFGTRHAAAQPFLRPALKHVEGPYKTLMREAFPGSR